MDISQKIQKLYEQTGISPEVYDFGEKIEKSYHTLRGWQSSS